VNSTHVYEPANWDAGFLAIPDVAGAVPNFRSDPLATFEANPVNWYTKFSGTVTNNCAPPALSPLDPPTIPPPVWLSP
jgi:hypothetical protein